MNDIITTITLVALPLILAITLHEVMHGYVAMRCGDMTAYRAGRISLNPFDHIDPVGTVLLPIALFVLQHLSGAGLIIFGWAKPVPVNFSALNNPRRDMGWVALAGPASNVVMAIFWGYLATYAASWDLGAASEFLGQTGMFGLRINIAFAAINLLPILPLDGGRVLAGLLPPDLSEKYAMTERYGFFILMGLVLVVPQILGLLLFPVFNVIAAIVNFFIL